MGTAADNSAVEMGTVQVLGESALGAPRDITTMASYSHPPTAIPAAQI